MTTAASAQTVTLAWNANSESDLAGYIVQYGTQSGAPTTNVDVGNVTTRQFTGLQAGLTYYFRVVAYNTSAMQSGPSNEVSYTVAAPTPAPALTSVTPGSGPTIGGTVITLNGTNFVSGATVRVNGVAATAVTFVGATQLRATTPAGSAGARAVQVTNPNGQSTTLNNAFTYVSTAPSVTSVNPASGPTAGGTVITLNGTNFVSGATVRVNGVAATGVTFVGATQLRATTPAGAAGARAVQVTNPDGQSGTLSGAFTYVAPAPSLTSVAPASGSTAGGTVITLNGTNFVSGATVRVNGVAATGVTFVGATQLRATTPAGSAGARAVQVTNPDGQSATQNGAFTYVAPAPTLTSVSPSSGSTAGGTVITLNGTNFVSGATVRVNGVAATGVTFVSASQLRATTPAGAAGTRPVQVTNPDGQSVTFTGFTYVAPTPAPTLTSVTPSSGPSSGGTVITLNGTNFVSGATVRVNGVAATGVTFVSGTQLRATTPAGTAGARPVQVVNPDAQSATLASAFTYVGTAPTLDEITPSSGPTAGGTVITITGANFASGATVRIGSVLATSVTFVSASQLRATTPAGTAGGKTVQVTNPNAQSVSRANGFTYTNSTLTLTSVTPSSGPIAGGTTIMLAGSGFVSGATVQIDGDAATTVFVSATSLRATTPPGTAGAKAVRVANPGGQSTTLAAGFTYTSGSADDTDGDGLPDAWERQFGLSPSSASGLNGAGGDPDDDDATNLEEYEAGTHPRGSHKQFLAEGAVNEFFNTRFAVANPQTVEAKVLLTFADQDGVQTRRFLAVPPRSRRTVSAADVQPLWGSSFATGLESDQQVVIDRLMTWAGQENYAAHAESAVAGAATTWYLAEGATGGPFQLFYLIQNPSAAASRIEVRYLLPAPSAPIVKYYSVAAGSRFTIWVNQEDRALANAEVSAQITSTNGVPVIVERSMYLNTWRRTFKGGHNSTGVTAPSTRWFLAEGATGDMFSMFVLFANPSSTAATVRATFMRDGGAPIVRTYRVAANSRYTINVAEQDRALRDAALAIQVESTNGVPIIVERTMWWPARGGQWTEGHNAFGTTATAARWLAAEGEVGGARGAQTFVLVANTSAATARVKATVLFESGAEQSTTFNVAANQRYTVPIGAVFPGVSGKRFSILIESLNPAEAGALVVERAMYWNTSDEVWGAGSDALATKLP